MFPFASAELMEKDLSNLSLNDQNNKAQQLQDILFKASSTDINVQLEGIKEVRNAASRQLNPPIDQLVALDIIPILVDCLKKGNEELELEATSTLATIASESSEWAENIVTAGAVPRLIQLLSSPNESLREWVVEILGHMIDAGRESANECFRQGVLDHVLISVTPVASSSFIESVYRIFVRLWKHGDNLPSMELLEKVISVLSSLLTREDLDTLFYSISMISWLAENSVIDPIIESGVMKQLVLFLSHDQDKIKRITVKALGNLVTGNDEQTQAVLDEGILKYFPGLLLSKNDIIVKDALWILSNITAGNIQQIQAVIDAGLIPSIIKALDEESDGNRNEALWAVSNISINGSTEQIMFLVDNGLIPSLCHLMTLTDNQVLMAMLTINNVIESSDDRQMSVIQDIRRCGGFDSVQMLKAHSDYEICNLALQIQEQLSSEHGKEGEEEPMKFEENC